MKRALFLGFLLPAIAWSELPKTYPSSPITTLYIDAFMQAFTTIYDSTNTIKVGEWNVMGSSYVFISPSTVTVKIGHSTTTAQDVEIGMDEYIRIIEGEMRDRSIIGVADKDIEKYMVWPGTFAPVGWGGWCLGNVAGSSNLIPISCP